MLLLLLLSNGFLYSAFLWDNDAGYFIYGQEIDTVGTEEFIFEALWENEINVVVDTLLPSLEELLSFDLLWINCAWRNDYEMIDSLERKTIGEYMDGGGTVYLEGNQVARILSEVDSEFLKKFGVKYVNTEDTLHDPSIAGVEGTFLQGELFTYNPIEGLITNVDIIDTLPGANAKVIFGTEEPSRFIIGRGIGSGFALRGRENSTCTTVFGSLSLCGLQKYSESPWIDSERRWEFVQKTKGFFGLGNILLVDDNESDDSTLQEDLDSMGVLYDVYDYDKVDTVPDSLLLRKYNVVLWTTGLTENNTVTIEDQLVINYYLKWGGRVMLAGEGIGSEIGSPGPGEDSWFLDLFGTDYISDSIIADSVVGIGEFDGFKSSLVSIRADSLTTIYGGNTILEYFPSHTPAGIKKEEAYNPFKTTFLGFTYEGMKDSVARLGFLRKTIAEFNFNCAMAGVTEEKEENLPETTAYPNPFTSYTVIPTRSNSFEVYSITGRFIKRVEGEMWYGRDEQGKLLPSGIYLFRSNSGERGKLILIR